MKTWDDWSDLEINAQVTVLRYNLQGWEYSDNMQQFYHCGACGNETHNQPVIDYCNSWADMGPLALSNNITIAKYNDEYCAILNLRDGVDEMMWDNIFYNNKPLRAAAIVFLEMNGVKP